MNLWPSFRGTIAPIAYAIVAPLLILSQYGLVALAYEEDGSRLFAGPAFWLLPLSRIAPLPDLQPSAIVAIFLIAMGLIWWLAALSFKRAAYSRRGYFLATLTVIPGLLPIAAAILAFMPAPRGGDEEGEEGKEETAHIIQGAVAGVGIIVTAVLISAVSFGAYGWGLFVATPFTVGLTTAYLANRRHDIGLAGTIGLVMAATALGGVALITLALEGLICLVLASPLVAIVAMLGGLLGRLVAQVRHGGRNPIACVSILPALFFLEAAAPPSTVMATQESVMVEAPPNAVWRQLVGNAPISERPGLVGAAGLAFPIRSELVGNGVGAERHGIFSTGVAHERVTEWQPGKRLGFHVERQPPAMEEMSPYRRVRAPHVDGYFETGDTHFELRAVTNGRTKVTVSAVHRLRLDPIPYWEPMARWAAKENARRVLRDLKAKAEAARG